jgi:hypothetical protein
LDVNERHRGDSVLKVFKKGVRHLRVEVRKRLAPIVFDEAKAKPGRVLYVSDKTLKRD